MGYPVVHFEVIGKDPKTLRDFYRQAFGWRVEPMPPGAGVPDYAMVYPAEGSLPGGIGGGRDDYDGHVTFYVEVPSLEDALKTIQGLGGSTMMPPDQVPGGPRIALFTDPEGHVIGLVQANSGPGQ